jgi:hypothetical protein
VLATRFIDDQLLHAVSLANVGRGQEYNQVVLVGDGMATAPFRLPWPAGTVIYLVAPGERRRRARRVRPSPARRALHARPRAAATIDRCRAL